MKMGQLISTLYDCSPEVLLKVAVEIKEHPDETMGKYRDFKAVKTALEKVLDIRAVDRMNVRQYYYLRGYGPIRNMRELRQAYELLGILDKTSEALRISIKCAIRRYLRRPASNRRIVKDNGIDGFIELIRLPDVQTKEAAEEYVNSHIWMEMVPSPYDCTGQRFSCWHKTCERSGAWYAYHCVAVDC